MHTFPHTECPVIEPAFAELEGLSVARGYTREVQTRFGGTSGLHPPRAAGAFPRSGGDPGGHRRAGPGSVSTGRVEDLLVGGTAEPVGP